MKDLKPVEDLPGAQQKTLFTILRFKQLSFHTSDVVGKMGEANDGRSVGAVLGSLARNGYLMKIQGGRDKMWRLSDEAEAMRDEVKKQISEVKIYWS